MWLIKALLNAYIIIQASISKQRHLVDFSALGKINWKSLSVFLLGKGWKKANKEQPCKVAESSKSSSKYNPAATEESLLYS